MKYLTKSRFKVALSCPTKLYYNEHPDIYQNDQTDDKFLEALAEGGYQVGELAKCYFPGGHLIADKGYEIPLAKTNELLKQKNVIIYEAAFKYNHFFIRTDILVKEGNTIFLIEVKAKSFDGIEQEEFVNNAIKGEWSEYLQDVAFQKFVIQKAFPSFHVKAFLMLADKSKRATVNGLNQKFLLQRNGSTNNITVVKNGELSLDDLGQPILTKVNIDDIVNEVIDDSFSDQVTKWAESLVNKEKLITPVDAGCFGCEFQGNDLGKLSGFNECWKHWHNLTDEQLSQPFISEIWNFRKKSKLVEDGIFFVKELTKDHLGKIEPKNNGTLSTTERQWLQIEKIQQNDDTVYLDKSGLKERMQGFIYPLHFIDFETSMSAIPFYANQRPYETIAFQFSHHVMYANGTIEHKDEYIKLERGEFPNFEFVRALKHVLSNDEGTIFRYAAHENTVLNQIAEQLITADLGLAADKEELLEFIYSITENKKENRYGKRTMVDMCQLVKDYFYDPRTKGSNSIKAVLPSILSRSSFLQEKYSQPIYGKNSNIKSKNFDDGWIWIQHDEDENVIDPYKLLPPIFSDIDPNEADQFITDDTINSGGAALTAFAKIQFTEMTNAERNAVIKGLLKYCELDTFAMVMIYEFWQDLISQS